MLQNIYFSKFLWTFDAANVKMFEKKKLLTFRIEGIFFNAESGCSCVFYADGLKDVAKWRNHNV